MARHPRLLALLTALLGAFVAARLTPRFVEDFIASPSIRESAVQLGLVALWGVTPPLLTIWITRLIERLRWKRGAKIAVASLIGSALFAAAVLPKVVPMQGPPHVGRPDGAFFPILFLGAVAGIAQLWRRGGSRWVIGFASFYLLLAFGAIGAVMTASPRAEPAYSFDRPFLEVQIPVVAALALAAAIVSALRRSVPGPSRRSQTAAARVLIVLAVTGSLMSRSLPKRISTSELAVIEAGRRLPDGRLLLYAVWPNRLDTMMELIAWAGPDQDQVRPIGRRPGLIDSIPWSADPVVSPSGDRIFSSELAPPWMWVFSIVIVDQVLDTNAHGRQIVRFISAFDLRDHWRSVLLGPGRSWVLSRGADVVVRLRSSRRVRLPTAFNSCMPWFDGGSAVIPSLATITRIDLSTGERDEIRQPESHCEWIRPPGDSGGVAARCPSNLESGQRWYARTPAGQWHLLRETSPGELGYLLWGSDGRPLEVLSASELCRLTGGELLDDAGWSDFQEMNGRFYSVHYMGYHGTQAELAELDLDGKSLRILPTWGFDIQRTDGVIIATGLDTEWSIVRWIDPMTRAEGTLFAIPFHWPPLPASSSSGPGSPD